MDITLPQYVLKIIETIENNGYEAWVVGGCVRDILLNKNPGDYDITTSAPPEVIASLFKKTVLTGIKHGTVTVIEDGYPVEVTTYRLDGNYLNSRHPDSVEFIGNIEDDLKRRDFTVNALCYHPKRGLLDLFAGTNDINSKILKTVGDPNIRFKEDALRILRLFRFSSTLSFNIDNNSEQAALSLSSELQKISKERIAGELIKTIMGDHLEPFYDFINKLGLSFLSVNKYTDVFDISSLPKDRNLRFFAFCKNTLQYADKLAEKLKLDNNLIDFCKAMETIENIDYNDKTDIKRHLNLYGEKVIKDYFILHKYPNIKLIEIIENSEPYKISDLKIGGNELLNLGIKGAEIGNLLNELLENVISGKINNTSFELLNAVKIRVTKPTKMP